MWSRPGWAGVWTATTPHAGIRYPPIEGAPCSARAGAMTDEAPIASRSQAEAMARAVLSAPPPFRPSYLGVARPYGASPEIGKGPHRELPPMAKAADLVLKMEVGVENLCGECGHRFADHGDRALAACAPDRGHDVGGMPLSTECWCRGWIRYTPEVPDGGDLRI